MPIPNITLQNTFDQWRAACNLLISQVNSLGSTAGVLSVSSPAPGQILVYDGTFFQNVTLGGDASIDATGSLTITSSGGQSSAKAFYMSQLRSLF